MHDDPKKNNARGKAGRVSNPKLAGGGLAKKKVLRCSNHSTNKHAREVSVAKLALPDACCAAELATFDEVAAA